MYMYHTNNTNPPLSSATNINANSLALDGPQQNIHPIWIQTVRFTDDIPKEYFKKVYFFLKMQTTKMHAKLASMLILPIFLCPENVILLCLLHSNIMNPDQTAPKEAV